MDQLVEGEWAKSGNEVVPEPVTVNSGRLTLDRARVDDRVDDPRPKQTRPLVGNRDVGDRHEVNARPMRSSGSPDGGRLGAVTNTHDADLDALAEVTADLVGVLGCIDEDQWTLATPCSEWDLAALVDHITGGNWFTLQILAGETSERAMNATMAQFDTGSATGSTAIQSARDLLEAFEKAHVLDQSWNHVNGALPGRQILRLRVHDLIVHTWDINETVRPPASVPAELAHWGLLELQDHNSLMTQHAETPAAAEVQTPTSDAASAYLRAFGRQPSRTRRW